MLRRRPILPLTALLLGGIGRAQQFQQATTLPGPQVWTEGVECADVDHDGDLDIFFAEGDGFDTAGQKRQNVLIINQLVEIGPWNFADESLARLGAHASNAKGVTTGDVDGDGWIDALFANAFATDPPFLYVNQGAASPGFFSMESATRGLTAAYSSGAAQFGDVDDDGDLDLVLGDSYNDLPAGRPHLFMNDGAGAFTENASGLNAPLKWGQMDIQLVDIDGDWDIDCFGANKFTNSGGNHYLLLGDGTGSFTDHSSLIQAGDGNTYEAEVGDLDDDDDLDLFFVSLSGFSEGAVENNLVPSGLLSFTNQAPLPGGVDDNEIALFDYDVDGDYDVLVGSLSAHEYLYRNDGGFAFADQSSQIQAISDSTLDCAVADLDNDGRYDIVTAQGESGAFVNRFYKNTGAVDARSPRLVAEQTPASGTVTGPVVVHARIRDQVLDDGVNYVEAVASYVINDSPSTASISITPGGFVPSFLSVPAGTTVTWTNDSGSNRNVASTTLPYTYNSGLLSPGGGYAYTFVTPGTYGTISMPGAFPGQVQVTGVAATAMGTHSGGQILRFGMPDTASGQGVQLCYELRITDGPGNVMVTPSRCVPLLPPPPGSPFCPGDGTLATPCPCDNFGLAGRGCTNSRPSSRGAVLDSSGTILPDTVVLTASGETPTALSVFMQADAMNSSGFLFGDGVRCVSGQLKRMYVKSATGGVATAPGAGDPAITARSAALGDPILPGATRYYQTYYRDPNPAFCPSPSGSTFNVTSGQVITW